MDAGKHAGAEASSPGKRGRCRARSLPGLHLGRLAPGPDNAITDVPGVLVGHSTIIRGEGRLIRGRGPIRTGVTAILPHGGNLFTEKVPAAAHVINGFGKAVGLLQVMECGVLETPILLTNTLNVGRVADAVIDHMLADNPEIGISTGTVNPVVAECNDGYLNDIQGRHVGPQHVEEALADARAPGPVIEGAVGAGTGMSAFGWKGGVGTASRLVRDCVLGALVLTNFGARRDLVIGGWPVGRYLSAPAGGGKIRGKIGGEGDGSVVIVLATNAPLDSRQLRRVAERAVVGIVRCGGRLHHGSGDFVIAFSTAYRVPHTFDGRTRSSPTAGPPDAPTPSTPLWPDDHPAMADLLCAAGEATEEAVLNSLFQAHTVVGRDGHVRYGLPIDDVAHLVERWERWASTPGDDR